jgi:hypothetical protein
VSYGADTWAVNGVRTGRLVTGKLLVAQALYRRLITPRGTLFYDTAYGFDLSEFVGEVGPELAAAAMPGRIRNELLKDDRVSSVDASVEVVTEGAETTLVVSITATLADSGETFTLTLGVSSVTTELLNIAA